MRLNMDCSCKSARRRILYLENISRLPEGWKIVSMAELLVSKCRLRCEWIAQLKFIFVVQLLKDERTLLTQASGFQQRVRLPVGKVSPYCSFIHRIVLVIIQYIIMLDHFFLSPLFQIFVLRINLILLLLKDFQAFFHVMLFSKFASNITVQAARTDHLHVRTLRQQVIFQLVI